MSVIAREETKNPITDRSKAALAVSRLLRRKEVDETTPVEANKRLNRKLYLRFSRNVRKLDLQDLAVSLPGREAVPDLSDYSLVPLAPRELEEKIIAQKRTSAPARKSIKVPRGIEAHNGRSPYLDSSLAIGLVHDGNLVAMAAAGLDPESKAPRLLINQIQGLELAPKGRHSYKKSGLHGGFLWRNSLVSAWMDIAKQQQIDEVAIQSAQNNKWWNYPYDPERFEKLRRLEKSYDSVANDMGFNLDTDSGNFVLRLE